MAQPASAAPTSSSATLTRRLLPRIVVAQLLVGLILIEGHQTRFYGTRIGVVAFAIATLTVFALLVWWIATSIGKADRERADDLRASDMRFRQMAEHIKEAFFIVDLDSGMPQYISPTWSEMSGRPVEAGYDPVVWANAIHPDDRERMTASLSTIRDGIPTDDEYRIARPDGTVRWVHGRAFPVRDGSGRVYRLVGLSADITELRQTQERFAQSQKMEAVGRLAGGVAHDFNNLLTVILGESEMLRLSLSKTNGKQELDNIVRAGESAVALTRQLLAFSKKQLVEPTVFPINEAVSDISRMLRRLIGERVVMTMDLKPEAEYVRIDRGQLDQVLTNLAVNARDAMPKGGTLTIGTSLVEIGSGNGASPHLNPGPHLLLTVTDTGTGMSEAVLRQAFEPFFSTKEHGQGTGLGLSTCLDIVRQAGGDITVVSKEGAGTTVRVHLPRATPVSADMPIATRGEEIPHGRECVLLVEDDDGVREVVARMLRELGYEVFEATDGLEAQAQIRHLGHRIRLLFTDVVLPGMSGRELAEWMNAEYPGIPVLFTTGYTDDVVLQHQLREHHVAVLFKPYSRGDLARKIRDALA